jgi:hypothetical protein
MADALFTVNGDVSNQGYDADPLEVLTLALKTQPVSGVSTVRFQIFDPANFDPGEDIILNPPRKAKLSPNLVFDNGDATGSSLSPLTVDGDVTLTMPADRFHAWLVRCVVNGGMRALADGRVVSDPSLIHERMIVVKDLDGNRPIVATETTQYEDDGWAPQVGLSGAQGATGPTGPAGPTGATGAASALRLIRTEIFRVGNSLETIVNGVSTFSTASSWAPNVSDGNLYDVWLHASGPGGGSSARGQTGQGRGQGGSGGGSAAQRRFDRTYIDSVIAALGTPIPITVGPKGTGGAGGTLGVANQNGVNGNPGALSSFGSLLIAYPGGVSAGAVTTAVGGGGGGSMGPGQDGASGITETSGHGGRPVVVNGATTTDRDGPGGGGGRGGGTGASNNTSAGWAEWGGGGGGGGNSLAAGEIGNPGGKSLFAGGGSGAGGGAGTGAGQSRAGGAGGGTGPLGLGGGIGGATPGADGGDGADGVLGEYGGAGGGGGAGKSFGDGGATTPGAGGNGGFPGGAGGSSGGCYSGGGNMSRAPGGDGADGVVMIKTFG